MTAYFFPVQINGGVITNSSSAGGQAWETLQFEVLIV